MFVNNFEIINKIYAIAKTIFVIKKITTRKN